MDNISLIASFSSAIKELIEPSTTESQIKSNGLFAYIRYKIERFNLKNIDIEEVISESYYRGIKYIKNTGKAIEIPEAFLKRTSLNVVREMKLQQNKFCGTDYSSVEYKISVDEPRIGLFSEEFSKSQFESLKLAFQKLQLQDRQLIYLRVVEEYSWQDIVQELSTAEEKLTVTTARKRGQRILEKLRKELN
jgi:DNA-directed RNA polymerase specialized sigma24 family protein